MSLFQPSFVQVFDNNGDPISGAIWKFYLTGTTTPTNVYSNATLTTSIGSTVTSDSAGRFQEFYIDDAIIYRAILTDASNITILDIDPFNSRLATIASTRAALQALSVNSYTVVYLLEAGRQGNFVWKTGNYSSQVSSDTLQGLYVPANSNPSGSAGCWVRDWDQINGRPEWFGAVTNDSTGSVPANNVLAIHAALSLCPVVNLAANDYYTSATIKHNYPNTELKGCGSKYNNPNGTRATRFILNNGTQPVIQFGPDTNPGSISAMKQGIKGTGIFASRSVAPSIPASTAGILVQFLLEPYFDDIVSFDSIYGWVFTGTVHAIADRCAAQRQSPGTGGTDSWKGFYVLGTSGIAAGGNASLYLNWCHADDNRTSVVNGTGFYADGKFTDCFWNFCETVSCTTGMEVFGNAASTNDYGSNDLTIETPKNDAFKVYGIYIHAMGVSGTVNIQNPYCGGAAGATAGIQLNGAYGVQIVGGEMVMGVSTTANGIRLENSEGCSILGTVISESTVTAVVVNNAITCNVAPVCKNKAVTGAEAVYLFGAVNACKFEAVVTGKANAFTFGYRVNGTSDNRCEFNCTGINSDCLNGGAAVKLNRNGSSITAAFTLTGTNYTSGVMT